MRVYNLSLYFLIFTFIVVTHSFAQPRGEGNQTGIMIVSEPSGAYVTLDGEYNFTGRTPFFIPYDLLGKYKIRAEKSGYQVGRRVNSFKPEAETVYKIDLEPRTRHKALYRSLLIPGWGHFYSMRKLPGVVYFGVVSSNFISAASNHSKYHSLRSDYQDAFAAFSNPAGTYAEQKQAFDKLKALSREIDQYKRRRNRNLYIAGGAWLLSVLENYIFYPNFNEGESDLKKVMPTIQQKGDDIIVNIQIPLF